YVGFVRGLETFSQLFVQDEISSAWSISSIPISIQDSPNYPYRGLMIDTARHFLSVNTILKTIDSMQYNKLNVLHRHITDDDSFPYPLQSFANVTQYGAFSFRKQYSLTDIQYIVRYALLREIQVFPEIDSPGHAFQWGKSPQFSNIALQCGNQMVNQIYLKLKPGSLLKEFLMIQKINSIPQNTCILVVMKQIKGAGISQVTYITNILLKQCLK
ncbi:hypothetical protein ABPG72_016695, partial [Tetrahymena utriculariae]